MIDLYTWFTPNGRKVSLMLEECELDYTTHAINIAKDEQFAPEFMKISPNNKIPAIVDNDNGKSLMESGAIMMYLADKTGKFWPTDPDNKWSTVEWLMFQMGGVGPMFGQAHHFLKNPSEVVPYGQQRYHKESLRLYSVMDRHFADNTYFVGDTYTIAAVATYPWVARHEWHQVDLDEFPNVKRWFDALGQRPAVAAGMKVPFLN